MPLTIKQVQDALISRIYSAVPALNRKTVVPYMGSVDALFEKGARVVNLPFCGVGFMGSDPSEENTSNTIFKEDYLFSLLLVCRDNRGTQYTLRECQGLIDKVRDVLIGWEFTGLSGLNPLAIGAVSFDNEVSEKGVAAYRMEITTFQIQS